MGVVFGLFSGFYYWFDIFFGVKYMEELGKLHFWLTFIGVNLTFFPQHFLGLAGMPRRIPDYPDVYYAWNYVSSVGSLITLFGLFVFIRIIFMTLIGFYDDKFYQIKGTYYFVDASNYWRFFNVFGTKRPCNADINTTYIFQKYNFWNVIPNNDLLYIYLDRFLLSIFLSKYSNFWLIDNKANPIFTIINKNNSKLFKPIHSIFTLSTPNNSLIACFLFLYKGWLTLFVYYLFLLSPKQFKLLLKLQLLNLIFFKFLGVKANTDNYLFLLLRKVNLLQKISLFL